jgi:protein-S-isoprenylcysteine O-methyltransferase Ste14
MMTTVRQITPEVRSGITKRMMQIGLLMVFEGALLFVSAGRLDWVWAWVFLGLYLVGILVNSVFMFRHSPETIARRASGEGMKGWDKAVSGLWAVAGVVQLIVAGLDVRYGWSGEFSLFWHLSGVVGFVSGFALFSWAMITNAYFATVVRIQTERGHTVCTTGPYRFVRHPGYVGAILESLALALLLGSAWALIPGAVAALMIVVRTALEDKALQKELPGYPEFSQKTRYRLLPGVW